ncbi:MAG: division/cell wall cluster transcriptional repressor MraZ [Arenicellales bacterium]
MYRGANQLKVDGKGRVALPTRCRSELTERCGGSMVITVNNTKEHCLWMYPLDEWEKVEKKINDLPSFQPEHARLKRFFVGYASDVEMDKTGRILLPPSLRSFARIEKEIYFIGQGNKFEIWSAKDWEASCDSWINQEGEGDVPTPEMQVLQL